MMHGAIHPDGADSLAMAMISDPKRLALRVDADEGVVSANASMSMGLVVTELVINAIKHGFPDERRGAIVVGYRSHGPDWTLSVADDGVGLSLEGESSEAGLGTSLVQALAKQLGAKINLTNAEPGTIIALTHAQGVTYSEDAAPVEPAL